MTVDEARRVLGVSPSATRHEVRSAYRRLVRAHHPDIAGPAGTGRAVRVIEAYGILTGAQPPRTPRPTSSPARPPAPPPPSTAATDADTVPLADATVGVFEQLCEAADVLGDVSYVDASCGILETIVHWPTWPPCSLLITLQQRGDETLAQCTLESLTGPPGPPIEQVVRELRRIMAALAE
jgi:molecular chaperone DnaJ